MTDTKREVLHMEDSNLAKLNVTRGENLAELETIGEKRLTISSDIGV